MMTVGSMFPSSFIGSTPLIAKGYEEQHLPFITSPNGEFEL